MTTLPRLMVSAWQPALVKFLHPRPNPLKRGHERSITQIGAVSELQDTDIPVDSECQDASIPAVSEIQGIDISLEQPDHVVEAGNMRSERGVQYLVGSSFYREESAVGRDLACLAAAMYKKEKGRLYVLDALSDSGIRAARYLAHSQTDFVWANGACDNLDTLIAHNLFLASTSKMLHILLHTANAGY